MFLKISRNFKKTFSIFAFSLLIFAIAGTALAVDYKPLVNVPGVDGSTLTGYLSGLYNFLISIVGILAMAVIVYGGMRYVVSAGNPAAMEDAKEAIWSAIYGLALALGSWLIINIVNPDILVLKNPGVGLPGGAYSYSDNPNSCLGGPSGNGTSVNPCICLDDAKAIATAGIGTAPANLTLNVAPTPVSADLVPPTPVTMSGKLTDAKGVAISGAPIKINRIKTVGIPASTTFTATTNATGDYTASFDAAGACGTPAGGDTMQAVFPGDATYTGAGSNTVNLVITTGGLICTEINYAEPLGPGEVATLWNGGGGVCQQVCSDRTKQASVILPAVVGYHCLSPKILATGTNVIMNPDGVSANMKVNGDVTLDGVTNSRFPNEATKTGSTFTWTIGGYTGSIPKIFLYSSGPGYPFNAAGDYDVKLVITPVGAPGVPEPVETHFTMHVAP
jgi:hypothetical protein